MVSAKWKRGQPKECQICGMWFIVKNPQWCKCCSRKCGAILRHQDAKKIRQQTAAIECIKQLEADVTARLRKARMAIHTCVQCNTGRCVLNNRCGACKVRISDGSLQKIQKIVERLLQQTCNDCGAYAGYYQHRCQQCRERKQQEDKQKKRQHKNYRQRCRKYGVKFDPSVTLGAILSRDKGRCAYCNCKVRRKDTNWQRMASIDHVIPLAAGGSHTFDNCVLACMQCNTAKSTEQWTLF